MEGEENFRENFRFFIMTDEKEAESAKWNSDHHHHHYPPSSALNVTMPASTMMGPQPPSPLEAEARRSNHRTAATTHPDAPTLVNNLSTYQKLTAVFAEELSHGKKDR